MLKVYQVLRRPCVASQMLKSKLLLLLKVFQRLLCVEAEWYTISAIPPPPPTHHCHPLLEKKKLFGDFFLLFFVPQTQKLVSTVPLSHLVLETDSPCLSPEKGVRQDCALQFTQTFPWKRVYPIFSIKNFIKHFDTSCLHCWIEAFVFGLGNLWLNKVCRGNVCNNQIFAMLDLLMPAKCHVWNRTWNSFSFSGKKGSLGIIEKWSWCLYTLLHIQACVTLLKRCSWEVLTDIYKSQSSIIVQDRSGTTVRGHTNYNSKVCWDVVDLHEKKLSPYKWSLLGWLASRVAGHVKNWNVATFLDTVKVINIKLCNTHAALPAHTTFSNLDRLVF